MPSRLCLELSRLRHQRRHRAFGQAADGEAVERHRRRAGAAVGGVDIDRVVEHLDRQAGGLGRFLGEHHRACAGVEHHRHSRAVDVRSHGEVAAAARARLRHCGHGRRRGPASVRRSRGRRRRAIRNDSCSRPPAAGRSRPRTASLRAPSTAARGTAPARRPPTNITSASLSASEPTSCAADWRWRPGRCWRSAPQATAPRRARMTQVRRRLTALSCRGRFAGLRRRRGGRAIRHDAGALGSAHGGPARDLVDGAAAAEAQPGTGIERADFDAGAFDHQSVSGSNRQRP